MNDIPINHFIMKFNNKFYYTVIPQLMSDPANEFFG